jgi:hypothetical protein
MASGLKALKRLFIKRLKDKGIEDFSGSWPIPSSVIPTQTSF